MGPNLIALAIPFFFLAIGVELLVARRKAVRVYRFPDAFADLGCGVLQQVTTLFWSAALLGAYAWVYTHARLFTLPTAWLPWVAAVLGFDLAYYAWHRLSHTYNLLWAAHGVHHQSEDYNLAVALRQSVTTSFTGFPIYAMLAVLGVPPLQFAVASALSLLYQFWIHTELVRTLGPLEGVLNTPSLHRVHHAINGRYLNKNHAGTFIVWDRLLGTWEVEREPCVYGVKKPLQSVNPAWAQIEGYLRLWRMSRAAPSLGQALKVWVARTAWAPTWWHEPEVKVPDRPSAQTKWAPPPTPPRTRRYVLAQFTVVLVATFSLLMWGGGLSLGKTALVVALIYLSLIALSAVLEGKPWARRVELARLVGVAALATWMLISPAPKPSALAALAPGAAAGR